MRHGRGMSEGFPGEIRALASGTADRRDRNVRQRRERMSVNQADFSGFAGCVGWIE